MTFDLHGVPIAVTSESEPALGLLVDRLGPYLSDTATAETSIEIRENPSTVRPADIREDFSWIRSRPLRGDFDGGRIRLTDEASVAVVDYRERSALIFIRPETLADRLFSSRTFLLLPILELLRTFGFFYVHGALLRRDDTGLLILGEGGSGKSTLTAALLTKAWRVVGDDTLLFRLSPDGVAVGFPLERELSIRTDLATQLGLSVDTPPDGGKSRIPLDRLPPDFVAPHATPRRIVSLRSGETDRVEPLPPSEAFCLLVEENPLLLLSPDLADRHAGTIEAMIRGARRESLSLRREAAIDLGAIAEQFRALFRD